MTVTSTLRIIFFIVTIVAMKKTERRAYALQNDDNAPHQIYNIILLLHGRVRARMMFDRRGRVGI